MSHGTAPLDTGRVAEMLRGFPAVLRAEVAALPPELVRWHPAPGEWCAAEAIGHLIETEQTAFVGRIRTILESPGAPFAPFDLAAEARRRRDCDRAAAVLLDEFEDLRAQGVAEVLRLREGDLDLTGVHDTVGSISVRHFLHEWVYHDRDHLRQIMANVQHYVWSHLGNTRGFYPG